MIAFVSSIPPLSKRPARTNCTPPEVPANREDSDECVDILGSARGRRDLSQPAEINRVAVGRSSQHTPHLSGAQSHRPWLITPA
jgi:hypothetical protein